MICDRWDPETFLGRDIASEPLDKNVQLLGVFSSPELPLCGIRYKLRPSEPAIQDL